VLGKQTKKKKTTKPVKTIQNMIQKKKGKRKTPQSFEKPSNKVGVEW
jgi:hypothetical protein